MTEIVKDRQELQVTTPTERELVLTRLFDAPQPGFRGADQARAA